MQTLKDNVHLFTPEILDEINQVIVNAGMKLKKKDIRMGRCDSFLVETNVHYPTDINLLFDAMRKIITLTVRYAEKESLNGWRQYQFNIRQIKRAYRAAQQTKRSTSKDEEKIQKRFELIYDAHRHYIQLSQSSFKNSTDFIDQSLQHQYG